MITQYDFGNSVCCQKVRITLVEKGLTRRIPVDLFKSEQYDPKYLQLNPKGVVPTLVHNGTPVIESTLICEYLDDTFRDPPLIPKDPAERARMRRAQLFGGQTRIASWTEICSSGSANRTKFAT
jgi:glutathione S-transferase